MFGSAKSQGSQKPTALGTLLQSSSYGSAIPTIYGMTQTPLLAIWAANIRSEGSSKKLKQMKKGTPGYCENIDFLIGHNPIMCVNQVWNNGSLYPLQLASATFSRIAFTSATFTISDPNFYSLIGVTVLKSYNVTFNDYGGPGPVTQSGSYPVPLWNQLEVGPDPTNPNSYRKFPYTFRWQPSYGATFYIDNVPVGQIPESGSPTTDNIVVYYYQLMDATSFEPPIQKNRLAFESELGDGTEYDGFEDQQIIYPMYAGLGSPNIDLGTTAALPAFQVECKGKWGYYPTGDGDFTDMIEDILKSGIAQASIGGSSGTAYTPTSHGLQGYTFPGTIQKKQVFAFESTPTVSYDMPNTAGNILVAWMFTSGAGSTAPPATITDTLGNTWVQAATQVTSAGLAAPGTWTLLYCLNCRAGLNTLTIANQNFYHTSIQVYELAGVDSLDGISFVTGANAVAELTTTNQKGFPSFVMAFSCVDGAPYGNNTLPPNQQVWTTLFPPQGEEVGDQSPPYYGQYQIVTNPTTVFQPLGSLPGVTALSDSFVCLLAFKSTIPSALPAPIGDYIDLPSLQLTQLQCQSYGLWGSMTMTSQQAGSDWLKSLYSAANAAPVYLGWKLYSIPYAEQSNAGNGAIYTAPTAAGPVAVLSDTNGDFVTNGAEDLVSVTTVDRSDEDNVLQMQCFSRAANYNQVVVSQAEAVAISLFSTRKGDPVVQNAVQDPAVARMLLAIAVRRNQLGGDTYAFTLTAKYDWITPMDLVNVTDSLAGIFQKDVRITSMEEQDDGSWACEAEPFVYGMSTPTALTTTSPTPTGQNNPGQSAGNVNAPVIFEPPARLSSSGGPELWIGISSSSPVYGGAQVLISTDGGASYNAAGDPLSGSATTGVSTADWPAATDPDTTNNLALDLSESLGSLANYSATERDNFGYPCYIAGGGSNPIPYELFAYNSESLTGVNLYTINATGTGNSIRRGVFGCPSTAQGVDHPSGSRFLFLSPSSQGILKLTLPTQWIGTELYIKVLSFNAQGGALQDASDVTAYTYTPTGVASSASTNTLSYTQSPAAALTQPTSTSIAMAAVTESFLSNQAKYNARTFTITAPTVPTWYYVTIADPGYVGDTGTATNRTAYCETSQAKVGAAGYTFIGAIQALPAGGAVSVIPGGYPTQQLFLVNGS